MTQCGGDMEERREASLPVDGEDVAPAADDKSAVVLSTDELTPVPDVSSEVVDGIVHVLTKSSDWLQQYEAVVMLRRVVVHHGQVIAAKQIEELLRPLALECDSLRSTPSKNGLLACAECFEFLPRSALERPLLAGAHLEVLDVLLHRSVCEKKFLRDAASIATQQLVAHLAGLPLLAAVARYGSNKNAKVCGTAAKLIAACLLRLQQEPSDELRQAFARKSESPRAVCRALAAFRESKDGTARTEATASFKRLGELLGPELLELSLKDALPGAGQAGVVARILKDAFPRTSAVQPRTRTGSLRDRMRQDTNARTGTVVVRR